MRPKSEARVLIVDDVASTTAGIREALIHNGFSEKNIEECHSPQHAKRILKRTKADQKKRFDVITIDLYMNGDMWAGTELCEFLKTEYGNGGTKSIVYTGVIYSRFADKGSVYLETGVANQIEEKLKGYEEDKVISAVLPKSDQHQELIDTIEKFYDESQKVVKKPELSKES